MSVVSHILKFGWDVLIVQLKLDVFCLAPDSKNLEILRLIKGSYKGHQMLQNVRLASFFLKCISVFY